ncbi:MAG: SMC-Scp complex subunit ScpB [Planctomycetes bacterium]|nr:SMC-Scp complex subunit ScpB [Planctomycetota bacterium]
MSERESVVDGQAQVTLEALAEALSPGEPVLGPSRLDAGAALDAVLTDLRGDAREREQQLEALLFSTHVPLTAAEIGKALGRSLQEVEAGLARLERALAERPTAVALFVREKAADKAYILDLKAAYRKDAAAVAPPMLKQAVTETLALVAINQPLSQARLVRERGSTVYEHVKELMGRGLIARQRKGRNYYLRTTDAFAAEFGLDNDPELIRRALARAAGVERTPEVVGSPRVHLGEGEGSPEALVAEALACVPPEPEPEPEPVPEAEAPMGTDEAEAEAEVPMGADEDEDCVVSGGEPPRVTTAQETTTVQQEEVHVTEPETTRTDDATTEQEPPPPSRIAHLMDLFQEQATTDDW